MRVAMVILEYAPIVGGAQRQLAAVIPRLLERGIDVEVLTRRVGDLPAHEEVEGVPVHRLPAPGPKAAASLAFTAAALARLARLRLDVVHAYSMFSPATVAILARRVLGVPTVVKVLRGGVGGEVARLRSKTLGGPRLARLRRDVDRFVVIAAEIDAELAGLGVPAERRRPIPNGVDTERFRPPTQAERSDLRERLGLGDGPIAVFCGRLVPEKRLGLLIEAWRRARARHPRAQLLIVGGGPEHEELRRLAGPGVRFEGEHRDVASFLRAADLFVLPSATEGLSNALLEAMAAGLPVVATCVGAAPDLVEDGVSGRLVRPDDGPGLADALDALLSDPAASELGARGRERVVARYSLDSVAERLAGLYGELVSSRRLQDVARGRAAQLGNRA